MLRNEWERNLINSSGVQTAIQHSFMHRRAPLKLLMRKTPDMINILIVYLLFFGEDLYTILTSRTFCELSSWKMANE